MCYSNLETLNKVENHRTSEPYSEEARLQLSSDLILSSIYILLILYLAQFHSDCTNKRTRKLHAKWGISPHGCPAVYTDCSLWETITHDTHNGGLGGHFSWDKSYAMIQQMYFFGQEWNTHLQFCQQKSRMLRTIGKDWNTSLCTQLSIFSWGLPRSYRGMDFIFW